MGLLYQLLHFKKNGVILRDMAIPDVLRIERHRGGLDAAIQEVLAHNPDVIIEGGTNNRDYLLHTFRLQGNTRPYIGMDIDWEIDFDRSSFTVHGNCLLPSDVLNVVESFGAKRLALVTFNALYAILSDKINPWDHKDDRDRIPIDEAIANISQLYEVQMHIIYGGFTNDYQLEWFFRSFQATGWQISGYGKRDIMVLTRGNQDTQ